MADDIDGNIIVEIVSRGGEEAGAPAGGGAEGAGPSTRDRESQRNQKKSTGFLQGISSIGAKILPMVGFVSLALKGIMGSVIFSTTFKVLTDLLAMAIDLLLLPLVPLLIPLIQLMVPLIKLATAFMNPLIGPLSKVLGLMISVLIPAVDFLVDAMNLLLVPFNAVADSIVGVIEPLFTYAINWWQNVFGKALDVMASGIGVISNVITNIFNWIKDKLGDIGGAIGSGLKKLWPGNWFDEGSEYVPKTMLAVVHKGERIIPAEENMRLMADMKKKTSPTTKGFESIVGAEKHIQNIIMPIPQQSAPSTVNIDAPVTVTAYSTLDVDDLGHRVSESIQRQISAKLRV